ncbi:MAG: hypothetical protein PF904_18245 [Kiritimatiellae bacterium]|nr:hypothetical protein [Kiritimatiellia bacterium]
MSGIRNKKSGQAMIESIFIIILTSLVFLALFQYANLFASKIILTHAAARAARCRSVGFNEWMVMKCARVASIPAAGKRITPAYAGVNPAIKAALQNNRIGDIWDLALNSNTRSPGSMLERGRVPDYMDSVNNPTAEQLLDYEYWDSLSVDIEEDMNLDGTTPGLAVVNVRMRYPFLISLKALVEGELRSPDEDEDIAIQGYFKIENHYPLYIEDANW